MSRSNPTILDADAVAALLPRVDVLDALRTMFEELARGSAVQPPQSLTLFPQNKGDFIGYLGVLADRGVFGVKLSPYIVTQAKPVITAWTQLMSMSSGQPLLLCDAGRATTERTGGTTALAVDLLASGDVRRLAIIGSGPVAEAHWRHVDRLRPWDSVRVWSRSMHGRAELRGAWEGKDSRIAVVETAEQACRDADVVLLCTSSGKPVVDPAWLSPRAIVTSISTNVAGAHEVPPEFLARAEVYCDYRATTPESAGEMVLASREFGWNSDAIRGDLPELVAGKCQKPSGRSPVFFRSIGLGLEDIAMADALLRASRTA
jgi:L-arginine dehydrogenase